MISNDPALADRLIGPKPALEPKLRLRVKAHGKARARRGTVRTFTVRVTNAGKAASGLVKLAARFPQRLIRSVGPSKRTIKTVPAKTQRVTKFRFRVRPNAPTGRVAKIAFILRETSRKKAPALRRIVRIRVAGGK